jgi:hypothetical protein
VPGPLPTELAGHVRGGLPGTEATGTIYADYLVEMTTRGEVVWEWRSWDHLDPADYPVLPRDRRACGPTATRSRRRPMATSW